MDDPVSQPNPNQPEQPVPSGWMVRHNDKIVGLFDNEFDATDAMNGYQMDNPIAIDDILEIRQII